MDGDPSQLNRGPAVAADGAGEQAEQACELEPSNAPKGSAERSDSTIG